MYLLRGFLWYFLIVGIAGLINLVARRKVVNGPYLLICYGTVDCLVGIGLAISQGAIGGAAVWVVSWFFPLVLARWTGNKFAAKHPKSFPPAIWNRKAAAPTVNAKSETAPTPL
jgi:hypothetical protein